MDIKEQLREYIAKCERISDLKLCQVSMRTGKWMPRIKSYATEQWIGAHYKQTRTHNGKDYVVEQIYCIGALPRMYTQRRYHYRDGVALCFRYDNRDWYVAGYFNKDATDMQPLGRTFILMPWVSGEIDDHYFAERGKSYTRVPMEVAHQS